MGIMPGDELLERAHAQPTARWDLRHSRYHERRGAGWVGLREEDQMPRLRAVAARGLIQTDRAPILRPVPRGDGQVVHCFGRGMVRRAWIEVQKEGM